MIFSAVASILKGIGSQQALDKALSLEKASLSGTKLHLRKLNLSLIQIQSIASILARSFAENDLPLTSISFSFNPKLGNEGAIALAEIFGPRIQEIGLVNCNIGDAGGAALLKWMEKAPELKMICMEHNKFTGHFQNQLDIFKRNNPEIVVMS
jgi:hypothetical protein